MELGIVSRVFKNKDDMDKALLELGKMMSEKSPVAIVGIKRTIDQYKRQGIKNNLEYVRNMNMSLMMGEDIPNAAMSLMSKQKPEFPKL